MDLGQIFDQSNKIERNKSINNDFCSKGTEKSSLKYQREEQKSKNICRNYYKSSKSASHCSKWQEKRTKKVKISVENFNPILHGGGVQIDPPWLIIIR